MLTNKETFMKMIMITAAMMLLAGGSAEAQSQYERPLYERQLERMERKSEEEYRQNMENVREDQRQRQEWQREWDDERRHRQTMEK
jgi:uncharacterized lipoprotein YajG